jgi:hypothetical protein
MFYSNTYKKWESVQQLTRHYDLFSQMVLKCALLPWIVYISGGAASLHSKVPNVNTSNQNAPIYL